MRLKSDFRPGLIRCVIPAVVATLVCSGCGGAQDTGGRVALQASVTIADQRAGDGCLILRPHPGVQCPLIKVSVTNGSGFLPEREGPVPGRYYVQFRPNDLQADLSEHLTRTGRVDPYADKPSNNNSAPPTVVPATMTGKGIDLIIPNKNPANVEIRFPGE